MAKDRLRRSKLLLCFINGFYLHRLPNLPNREEPGKHRSHGCFKRLLGSCLFSWCESGQSLVCQEAWDFVFWDASASYFNIFILLHVWVFRLHACQGTTHKLGARGGQKKGLCFFK